MPQILKAEIQAGSPVSMVGVKNVFSHFVYRKPFLKIQKRQQAGLCQALAAGVSVAMIIPVAVILYFVIQNLV